MMKISKNLKELAQLFNKAGANLYIVGGAVRNYLLNLPYTDIDICSYLSLDDVMEKLSNTKFLVKIKNALTQTAQIIYGKEVYEYARTRIEEYEESGERIPIKINFTTDISKDYLRRDFTCNALYYDILNGKIVDFCNGEKDIKNKILNTVQDANITLKFDALRLLRLVRFSLYYNIEPTNDVLDCAKQNAFKLLKIKGQSKKEELIKILPYGTDSKDYHKLNNKKLNMLLSLNYIPYLFSSKLKKIEFDACNIELIFPLSLNCNKKEKALECFVLDLYAYILSKQIFIDKEIIELILGQEGLGLSKKEIEYYSKLCFAYSFKDIEKNARFYIYLNNEIIDNIIQVFNFNNDYKNIINTLNNEIKTLKRANLPINLKNLNITSKDIFDANLTTKTNYSYILKRVHYVVLFEHIKNNKEDIMQFISKNFK